MTTAHTAPSEEDAASSDTSVSTLRGAGVDVDVRRVGVVLLGVGVVALAVLAIALIVAGAHKNAQITSLRRNGEAVEVTVSGCSGLLGGSGSNAAGYVCKGTITVDGHRYRETLPGDTLYSPGTGVRAVAVPGHPPLFSTARALATERSSWKVFVLPTVILVIPALLLAALALRRRHVRRGSPQGPSTVA